jgi:uncharacterized delta-60 repeat protein
MGMARRTVSRGLASTLASCALASMVGLCLFAPAESQGRVGGLDPTFGDEGRVITPLAPLTPPWDESTLRPPGGTSPVRVATGSDGSVVVAAGNVVLRYLPNGDLDPAFGEAGKLAVRAVEGLPFLLSDVAVDSQGRIVVFGTAVDQTVTDEIIQYWIPARVNPSFVAVLRINPNGQLDPSFGGGDGIFRSDLGLYSTLPRSGSLPLLAIRSAKLDSAGRAVMTVARVGFLPHAVRPRVGWITDSLARLTPTGEPDTTFGGGDGALDGFEGGNDVFVDFCVNELDEVIVASQKIMIEGEEGKRPFGWLMRRGIDGTADLGFGTTGAAYAYGGSGPIACGQRSDDVVMLQSAVPTPDDSSARPIIRLSAGGVIDRDFGRRGRATVRLPGRESTLGAIAVDENGTVLVAGTLSLPRPRAPQAGSLFTIIRLRASGRPDRQFGLGGRIKTGFGRNIVVSATEVAIDSLGRLLVIGSGRSPKLEAGGVVIARYLLRR